MSIRQSDMMFLRAASIGHMNNMWDFVNNHGVDVDIFDKYGRSACHYAVANGNLEMVEYLIECGADMNAPERLTGMTPVHLAVEKYQLEILHLLLSQNDVNPNLACLQTGFTPLHLAIRMNYIVATIKLIEFGADAKKVDKFGFNPSYWAQEKGFDEYLNLPDIPKPVAPSFNDAINAARKEKGTTKKGIKKKGTKKKGTKKKK